MVVEVAMVAQAVVLACARIASTHLHAVGDRTWTAATMALRTVHSECLVNMMLLLLLMLMLMLMLTTMMLMLLVLMLTRRRPLLRHHLLHYYFW